MDYLPPFDNFLKKHDISKKNTKNEYFVKIKFFFVEIYVFVILEKI